jgi:Zn-dependent protease
MSFLFPEPSRYDLHFTVGGIPTRVTPWFWLAQGAFGLFLTVPRFFHTLDGQHLLAVPAELMLFPVWILCAFVSILVHELGHVLVGRWFGSDGEIVLTAFGGLAPGSPDLNSRFHRIAVYLAGPIAQFVLAGAVWSVSRWFQTGYYKTHLGEPQMVVAWALSFLLYINIAWPLFNLLPIPPLDGGQVLREAVLWFRFGGPPPWEQDANWWKRGSWSFGEPYWARGETPSPFRRLFPWLMSAAVGAFLVWWAYEANRHRRQHEAFAKLQRIGARFGWDERDRFFGVSLRGCNPGEEDLALLEVFDDDHFDSVDLSSTPVNDAGLRHLSGLKGLRLLWLQGTEVGNDGLKHLAGLKRLHLLYLSDTQITDAGLMHLEGLQKLQWLSLSRTGVTDAGLIHLRGLRSLQELHVEGTAVSAEGIADLKQALPALRVNPKEDGGDR